MDTGEQHYPTFDGIYNNLRTAWAWHLLCVMNGPVDVRFWFSLRNFASLNEINATRHLVFSRSRSLRSTIFVQLHFAFAVYNIMKRKKT